MRDTLTYCMTCLEQVADMEINGCFSCFRSKDAVGKGTLTFSVQSKEA
jgi:hypothetical protein